MIIEIIAAGIALFLLLSVLNKDTPPLNGIYAQPGTWYHVKRAVFYVFYCLRQRKTKSSQDRRAFRYERSAKEESKVSGYGERSHVFIPDMDRPQPLADHPDALDCAYFEGTDKHGTCFIMRIGRRHGRRCELWLSINIPDIGFYQLPMHPATIVYNTDGETFSAGGMRFQCLEPMSKWRVTFNGLMQKGPINTEWSDGKRDLFHVKFSFMWDALSEPFDFDTDISPNTLSDAIAREPWSKQFFHQLRASHQTHYEQCGEMRGVLKVEGSDEVKIRLKSIRDHSYGIRDWSAFHRYIVHFGYLEDGTFFHVNHICLPATMSYLKCGYVARPNAEMHPVTWTDLELSELGEDMNPPQSYSFNFTAGGRTYSIAVSTEMTPVYYHGDTWNNKIFEKICKFECDGRVKGFGISEFCYRRDGGDCPLPEERSVPLLQEPSLVSPVDSTSLVLPFTVPAATLARLVGGKGCQLAMLTQMEDSQSFVVPAGFSLTIAAFHQQLRKSAILRERVTELEDTACGRSPGELRVVCEAAVAEFLRTELAEEVREALDGSLRHQFGDDVESKAFAVRSSAAGEDSAELSAAGQMDTILGVKGSSKQIQKAVAKCWASHFAHTAVEYRRQHGQPIYSSMGVVIQEMVPAQAAGVLFTRDPISGNPALMVINANYGLGESVVSGMSEPDNICVRRQLGDVLSIVNKDVGSKKKQITVTTGVGGTKTIDVSEEESEKCSISNDVILRLARIGIELEKAFSDPRDIEWAVAGETIYLLQARPITALDLETEWEMIHEFDSPLAMDKEMVTTSNIGEMLPDAMTPLTLSIFGRGIDWALQDMMYQQDLIYQVHKFRKYMYMSANQGLINMYVVHSMWEKSVVGGNIKMAQLAIMGETIDEITFKDLESYHGVRPLHKRLFSGVRNFLNLKSSYAKTVKWGEMLKTFAIGENAKTAQQLFDAIDEDLPKYMECWSDTVMQSARSGSWSAITMSILSQGDPNWTTEMYSDVAMLLSKCDDVYSADVPAALQELAKVIAESGKGDEFAKMSIDDAVRWLSSRGSSGPACHDQYASFLLRHGHRCIREAEFRERSWQSDPAKLITVLQSLVPAVASARKPGNENAIEDIDEAIAKIKSPLTKGGRFAMKYVLPRARKAVGGREWGKSISIQMVEAFKQAYWRLADIMVKEGRLPDADLLFFFTHDEIRALLADRSGKLIAKGQRRRKLLSKQMDTKIERINFGHPVPVEESDAAEADYVVTSVTLNGLPVSQGVVRGTARVVTSLSDAADIQLGDVLIVHYTDVGWSPYFPLISGLVTEIGGLVSHGAVVAREYGLPCIVNVKKATTLFRTGDQVILNGTLGTLEKLEDTAASS